MALDKYLRSKKLKFLKKEVKSLIDIQLKTILCWLIGENPLKEKQKKRSIGRSAIVITIINKVKAKQLLANVIRFRGDIKIVQKY